MPPKKDNSSSTTTPTTTTSTATALAAAAALDVAAAEQKQALFLANAKLCRLVKRCPWMYDRQHENYAKKQIVDKSWAKIAKDCDDSVASCKDRWRNIRAAFARSINIYKTSSGPNRVKPYYLHNELQFLIQPMMDGKELSSKELDEIKADLDDTATLKPEEEESIADNTDLQQHPTESQSDVEADLSFPNDNEDNLSLSASTMASATPLREISHDTTTTLHSVCDSSAKSFSAMALPDNVACAHFSDTMLMPHPIKRAKLSPGSSANTNKVLDADAKFLEALLPDMRAMNARQKIVFKRKIYQSLEEVFDTNTDFPPMRNAAHTTTPTATPTRTTLMSAFPTVALSNSAAQSVAHSIASLRDAELQQVQQFVQNIYRIRGGAHASEFNASQSGVSASMRHSNGGGGGHAVTFIPRAQCNTFNGRHAANASNVNGGGSELLQPIVVKYELTDDETVDDFE